MVVHPSTGHQNPSYLPQFSPIYFHLIFSSIPVSTFIFHIYFPHITPNFLLLKISYYFQFNTIRKKFFYMPAQIPRILYHRPSLNPLILSLNKYSQSRIILENPSQYSNENYFPELLKPHLDNINLLCYNILREPV